MRSSKPLVPCFAAGLLLLSGCGGGSSTPVPALAAPGSLTATAGDGQVGLAWTAVPSATSYTVLYHEQNAPEAVHQQPGLTGLSSTVTGLLDQVPYVFSVAAVNAAGSATSVPATATPTPALSLVSIAITPTAPSIGWPVPQVFAAVGTYADASMQTLTDAVQWFSDDPSVVIADLSTGLSLATGSAHLTAHLDGVTSNEATVTVGATILTGSAVRTTTTTTTTSAETQHIPMDVQTTLVDGTWSLSQVAIVQQPAHGVATVSGLKVTYVPEAGYAGPDSFVVTETSVSGQAIAVPPVVLGINLNTNTNTDTITLSVE